MKLWFSKNREVSYIDAPIHPTTIRKNNIMRVKIAAGGDQDEFQHILPLMKFYTLAIGYIGDRVIVLDQEKSREEFTVGKDEVQFRKISLDGDDMPPFENI